MPTDRTLVTELATALGTLPYRSLGRALAARPAQVRIAPKDWRRLEVLHGEDAFAEAFAVAYDNGKAFAANPDALAGRQPRIIEWTGGRRPPGDEVAPIDLRIDHVYMVSCKYLSSNIANPSPARLFNGLLATVGTWNRGDWYQVVAPKQHQRLFEAYVAASGISGLPDAVANLSTVDRKRLRAAIRGVGSDEAVKTAYASLSRKASSASAMIWKARLKCINKELMFWRLLRIGNAPYFFLGAHKTASLRLRVATAWDWRDTFHLRDLKVDGVAAGQPKVEWTARYYRRGSRKLESVHGHVEIRWSHGPFAQPPEAKIYLDSPVSEVPGYHPL